MSDRPKPFPFDEFEPRWQALWEAERTFRTPNPGDPGFDPAKPKFYVLDMFPYPSGAGLHVGHPEGYTATDILARTRRRQGFNVLHPMGWDSFGLPAEQYAIKTGRHPRATTEDNITTFRRQLKSLGFGYDWDREIATTDPRYVRWTQWIFLQLYNSYFDQATGRARPVADLAARGWSREQVDAVRLAYVSEAPVNWSPDLGTVLANEEVEEWRAKGHTVERRPLRQWMLRITSYAERLLNDLDPLDWPEGIKLLQRNWIGRSEGASVKFQVSCFPQEQDSAGHLGTDNLKLETLEVFTTRPDTLFGATYMVLAPEHPLVARIAPAAWPAHTPQAWKGADPAAAACPRSAIAAYLAACAAKSDLERGDLNKEKTGVFTGASAVNPVNNQPIPVWIADYVMMGYGTGAIMAVPAHDTRDFEFATKFGLPIAEVVARSAGVPPASSPETRAAGATFPYLSQQEPLSSHRRYLPHWQQDAKWFFVTWRLVDSLPQDKLDAWRVERDRWLAEHPEPWSDEDEAAYHERFSAKVDEWLDQGAGECLLRDPACATIVAEALRHFDGERYLLDSFVVMPNHVHVLFRLAPGEDLARLLHSWKSFTSKQLNQHLGRKGERWQPDYWDRLIRGPGHLANVRRYIRRNPELAGLVEGEFVLFDAADAGVPPALPEAFTDEGTSVNSGFISGLPTAEAKRTMIAWLEEHGLGAGRVQYKLRDWLFSRQRYWGEPFPIVWDAAGHRAVPEAQLPVLQPEMADFKPTGDPRGPLAKAEDWIRYSDDARRETNTMPQWAGSCWYYLRFCDPRNPERFIDPEVERYWSGTAGSDASPATGMVDLYVGGTEHAVLHLLYARFWHKVLHDLGHVSTNEPFQRLVNQGLILGEDGRKMSKSFGNVVNPDEVVRDYGADALRLYEMFMGPLEQVKPWSMKGVEGVARFLARVWRVAFELDEATGAWRPSPRLQDVPCADPALRRVVHETVRKVTDDIARLSFNTAIAQMMVCVNAFTSAAVVPLREFRLLLDVLNPFAPHLTEELNLRLGGADAGQPRLAAAPWPAWDESALAADQVELVVQVNGKLRDKVMVAADADRATIEAAALASARVRAHTDGRTIRKVVVVPGRLVNIVAS